MQSTTISISMNIILKGAAHERFNKNPEVTIEKIRESLIGKPGKSEPDDVISVHGLEIKHQNQ